MNDHEFYQIQIESTSVVSEDEILEWKNNHQYTVENYDSISEVGFQWLSVQIVHQYTEHGIFYKLIARMDLP